MFYQMRFVLFFIFLFHSILNAQVNDEQRIASQELMNRRLHNSNSKNAISAAQKLYDVYYYEIDVQIDPNVKYINGNSTVHFTTVETLNSIELDLSSALKVDSIKYKSNLISFTSIGKDKIKAVLNETLFTGDKGAITVWYQGVPPVNGFNAFDKRNHAGAPIIWTFSCPDNADDWWACKNTLDDKADSVSIIVRNPSAYKAIANGMLEKTEIAGNQTITYWKHRYPITTYLIAVAVTNYETYSDYLVNGSDSLEILNYVYPESLSAAKTGTAALLPVIQFYEEKFGPYPFRNERFGHAQFSWGGGMEHQTTAFVTDFSKGLLAHELSHQWFGDMVTCSSFTEAWLNEGFATYVTALIDEKPSPNTFKSWRSSTINSITGVVNGSIYCKDTTDANRIYDYRLTYQKGAMVLHMLRWVVGDSAFFQGVRNYLNDPLLKYKYATTNDLRQHLEISSGKDLKSFFDKWFLGEGYPKYELRWNQTTDNHFYGMLNQTTSHTSVSFYDLPVEIKITGTLNSVTTDTTILINHFNSGQKFDFQTNMKILSVAIDPNLWLISKKTVIKDVTLASDEVNEIAPIITIPNPFTNTLEIKSTEEIISIQIFDFDGKLIFTKPVKQNSLSINTTDFAIGNYVLLTETKDGVWSQKVVKQ